MWWRSASRDSGWSARKCAPRDSRRWRGGGDDGVGKLKQVGGFAGLDRMGSRDVPPTKLSLGSAEVAFAAHNAGGVPHELLEGGAAGEFVAGEFVAGPRTLLCKERGTRCLGNTGERVCLKKNLGCFQICGSESGAGFVEEEVGGAVREDDAFEQGVGGEAIGTVDAGAGDLADGEEAWDVRPAEGVGLDATHPVVGGGGDRNGGVGPVEAGAEAGGVDGGEAGGEGSRRRGGWRRGARVGCPGGASARRYRGRRHREGRVRRQGGRPA